MAIDNRLSRNQRPGATSQKAGKLPGNRQSRARPAGPGGLESRLAAFDVLMTQLRAREPLDEVIERTARFQVLPAQDRRFAYYLLTTVLRRQGQIDALIETAADQPGRIKQNAVRMILRLGVAQIAFMDVPAHAAVDTSVRLTLNRRLPHAKGLINALLRRVAGLLQGGGELPPVTANLPGWLSARWVSTYGAQTVAAMAAALAEPPPLDLTVKTGQVLDTLASDLNAAVLPNGTLRLRNAGDVTSLPGYCEGRWWVQDAASALPVQLLNPGPGERIADLCAAPGGKTAQIAAAGATVTAIDRSGSRLERVRDNLKRLSLDAEIVEADATVWAEPEERAGVFDAVLVDAPCSATGTIRRHPEIAHLRAPGDEARHTEVQARLIDAAVRLTRPGGRIVFATCSLEPEEGEVQAAAARGRHGQTLGLGQLPVNGVFAPGSLCAGLVGEAGYLRTTPASWPDHGGMDGFFAVLFTRL